MADRTLDLGEMSFGERFGHGVDQLLGDDSGVGEFVDGLREYGPVGSAGAAVGDVGLGAARAITGGLGGLAGGIGDLSAIAYDVATGPEPDSEIEGFWSNLADAAGDRGADFLQSTIGPDSGFGRVIGELPEGFRQPVGRGLDNWVKWANRGFTASFGDSIASGMIGLSGLTRFVTGQESLGEAYDYILEAQSMRFGHDVDFWEGLGRSIPMGTALRTMFLEDETLSDLDYGTRTEGTSPGSLYYMAMTGVDITDPDEFLSHIGTPAHTAASGLVDGFLRMTMDLDILGFRAVRGFKIKHFEKPITDQRGIDRAVGPGSRFKEDLIPDLLDKNMSAERIRRKYIGRKNPYGNQVADLLKDAAVREGEEGATLLMRHVLGDARATQELVQRGSGVFDDFQRLTHAQSRLVSLADDSFLPFTRMRSGQPADASAFQQGFRDPEIARVDRLNEVRRAMDPQELAGYQTHRTARRDLRDPQHQPLGTARGRRAAEPTAEGDKLFLEERLRTRDQLSELLARNQDDILYEQRKWDIGGVLTSEGQFTNATTVGGIRVPSLSGMKRELADKVQYAETWQRGLNSWPVQKVAYLGSRKPAPFLRLEQPDAGEYLARQFDAAPGFSHRKKDELLKWFEQSPDPTTRAERARVIENRIIGQIASEGGMDPQGVKQIVRMSDEIRGRQMDALQNPRQRTYDGGGRSSFRTALEDGTDIEVQLPLHLTQADNVMPLLDMKKFRRATKKIGKWQLETPAGVHGTDALNRYTHTWKWMQLMRPAWPLRTIMLDEQLRLLARVGGMAQQQPGMLGQLLLDQGRIGVHNMLHSEMTLRGKYAKDHGLFAKGLEKVSEVPVSLDGFRGGVDAQGMLSQRRWQQLGDVPGFRWIHGEHRYPSKLQTQGVNAPALYSQNDASEMVARLYSTQQSYDSFLGRISDDIHFGLQRSGDWTSLAPGDANYFPAWQNALNHQIGQSPIGQMYLKRMSEMHAQPPPQTYTARLRDQVLDDVGDVVVPRPTDMPPVPKGHVRLYRGEAVDDAGEYLASRHLAGRMSGEDTTGRWYTSDFNNAQDYAAGYTLTEGAQPRQGQIKFVDVPEEYARRMHVNQLPDELARQGGVGPFGDTEYLLDPDYVEHARTFLRGGRTTDPMLQGRPEYAMDLQGVPFEYAPPGPGVERLSDVRQEAKRWLLETEDGMRYLAENESYRRKIFRDNEINVNNQRVSYAGVTPDPALPPKKWIRASDDSDIVGRVDELLDAVEDQIFRYTAGLDSELVRRSMSGSVTEGNLVAAAGRTGESMQPVVHGEELMQVLGKSKVAHEAAGHANRAMERLGVLTSDQLLRNPYANRIYRHNVDLRVKRALDSKKQQNMAEELTQRELDQIVETSRQITIRDTKELLYDFAEASNFAEMVRHISPFFAAFEDAITRWVGLAVENPVAIGRARQVVGSPDQAGWGIHTEEDDDGNVYITVPVPEFAKSLPGGFGDAVESVQHMRFNRRHLNLITQGPGTSALVTVPASQFVRRRPEAEEALDFFLPFGPRSLREEVLPSTVDRAVALSEGEENRAFANQMMRIWQNEMMKVQNDQRESLPTYEEVEDKARKITYLRMVGGFTLPANPQFISPYEPYLQALRQMREDDPLGADDRFLEKYGDEFFALTETITESQAAIPPTPEGDELGRKYRDLIVEAPELTSLIIGEEGAGEFSRAVYESQFDEALEAGTGQPIRETQSYEDWVANAERREGWREFSRLMDQVDAIREDWGLPNFMVAEAEPLRRAREAIREDLAQRYPE